MKQLLDQSRNLHLYLKICCGVTGSSVLSPGKLRQIKHGNIRTTIVGLKENLKDIPTNHLGCTGKRPEGQRKLRARGDSHVARGHVSK